MKNIIKILTVSFVLLFVTAACDDFVDIEPQYGLDADNYFLSPQDYDKALTGAYDLLQTTFVNFWIGEIASDNSIAGGESPTDTEGLHQIDAMTHGGVNAELRNIWRWMYAGVARTNYIFEFQDNIDFPGKEKILAQASFLRAYYYFELVKFFGDVPLVIGKRLDVSELSSLVRTPKATVYGQIEADLQYAADNLDWTDNTKGRVTKGAALSLLGKVYLYQDKFAEAAIVFDQVYEEGPYSLYGDFNTLFRVSAEGNSETVFDVEYVGLEGGDYGCFVCLEGNAAVGFHGIRGYSGLEFEDGNSYNLPTQDLVDAFESNDPRLAATILDIEEWIAMNSGEEITYVEGGGGHTGYYNNKYLKRKNELGLGDTDLTTPVNYRAIRYADVLLMAAEAHNRKTNPDDEKALDYLTEVRDRVGLTTDVLSGTELTEAIFHERRIELAGEGHRFFDLVRTGRAADEIAGFTVGKNEVFPIPQDEIDLAGAGWEQNPNY